MKTKREREAKKRKLSSTKRWVEKQESGGGSLAWNLPDGMQFYKWKKGLNRLDFIPFVASSGNPNAEEGDLHWEREYYVHQIPGPSRRLSLNCLVQTCGKNRCPGCELCAQMLKDGAKDTDVKKLEAKRRHGSFVVDLDDKEAGVQFLEYAHYKSFGEMMKDELESAPDDSPILEFHSPSDGMTVEVMAKEDTHEGRKYMKPYKINFTERKKQYKDSFIDKVPCLDDLLNELSFKEFAAKLGQGGDPEGEDDEDEDKPKKGKKVRKAKYEEDDDDDDESDGKEEEEDDDDEDADEDDEEGDEEDDDDDEDSDDDGEDDDAPVKGDTVRTKKKVKGKFRTGTIKKVNPETGLAKIEDEDGEVFAENVKNLVVVEEDEEEEDDDEDEKPAKKKKGKKKQEEDDEDEDDDKDLPFDDEDDEEEEDEKPKKKRKK